MFKCASNSPTEPHLFLGVYSSTDPQRWNFCSIDFPNPDQVVDKVAGRVALGVLLVGRVSHPSVTESFHSDLDTHTEEGVFGDKREDIFVSTDQTHLTRELLSVFVSCCSDVIVRSHFLLPTPGVQEVLNVSHDGLGFTVDQ